jgi:hypothetical protein
MWLRVAIGFALTIASVALAGGPASAATLRGSVELFTTGPTAGLSSYQPRIAYLSADGRHLFFDTPEQLVAEDQDGGCPDPNADDPDTAPKVACLDVYERSGGRTRLISFGSNGPSDAFLVAISSDGSKAFFGTGESLVPEDTDTTADVYEWQNGSLALVTKGTTQSVSFARALEDGSKFFFESHEQLTSEDRNNCADIYEYSRGTVSMVSTGPTDPASPGYPCDSLAIYDDRDHGIYGAHFFFDSYRPLVAEDRDGDGRDIYERNGDRTTLVSTGPTSDTVHLDPPPSAIFFTASPDGSHVFFESNDRLVPEATGRYRGFDTYERDSSGVHLFEPPQVRADPSLVAAPFATSYDGSRVYLTTNARLDPADTDDGIDIYERLRGRYVLVSTGPFDGDIGRFEVSRDGRAFFTTVSPLVSEDTDSNQDVYEWVRGVLRLVTPGTPSAVFRQAWYATPDGSHFFFETLDPVAPEDTDTKFDVYEWDNGSARLLDPGVPTTDDVRLGWIEGARAASDDGRTVLLATRQALTPADTDTLADLYAFRSRGSDHICRHRGQSRRGSGPKGRCHSPHPKEHRRS